jgi:hypothetical protein
MRVGGKKASEERPAGNCAWYTYKTIYAVSKCNK